MRSEAVGELKTRSAVEMRAFDSLPRIVRDALNDMVHGFPASEVKRVLARGRWTPEKMARALLSCRDVEDCKTLYARL
mgnify:FL=1